MTNGVASSRPIGRVLSWRRSQRHKGGIMPNMLIRYALAAAIAGAATPAWSAGIPDFGTKNFSPGSDAPSYFSNETGAFLGAAASESEDGNDVPGSMQAAAEPDYSVSTGPRHHSRLAYTGKSGSRGVARGHSLRFASTKSTRSTSASRSERSAHSTSAAQPAAKARMPRSGGAKFGKSGPHHASLKSSSRNG